MCGRRERIFSTRINLFGMPEEHIIRTYYRLPSHVILNLLQEIKDNMEPSTNFLQPFIGLRCFSTHCGLFSWDFTVRIFTCVIHGPEVTDENISKSPGSSSPALSVVLKSLMKTFPNRPEALQKN